MIKIENVEVMGWGGTCYSRDTEPDEQLGEI